MRRISIDAGAKPPQTVADPGNQDPPTQERPCASAPLIPSISETERAGGPENHGCRQCAIQPARLPEAVAGDPVRPHQEQTIHAQAEEPGLGGCPDRIGDHCLSESQTPARVSTGLARPMKLPPRQQGTSSCTQATRRRALGFTALVCLEYNPSALLPARGNQSATRRCPRIRIGPDTSPSPACRYARPIA